MIVRPLCSQKTLCQDLLGTDGYTRDKPAGPAFLLLDAEDYKGTLNKCQCNLIRAAQLAQGGNAGVLLMGCMLWQGMTSGLGMHRPAMARACGEGYHLGAQASSAKPFADALLMHEPRGEAMLVESPVLLCNVGPGQNFSAQLERLEEAMRAVHNGVEAIRLVQPLMLTF